MLTLTSYNGANLVATTLVPDAIEL
jgi:hypothetical protein